MKKTFLFTLYMVLVMLLLSPASAIAGKKLNYFVIIGASDNTTVTRCMQIVQMYHSAGKKVELFLMDDAVIYSEPGGYSNFVTTTGDSLGDRLDYIVNEGIPMCVCGPCADARGIDTGTGPHPDNGVLYENAQRCGGAEVVGKSKKAEVLTCF